MASLYISIAVNPEDGELSIVDAGLRAYRINIDGEAAPGSPLLSELQVVHRYNEIDFNRL